MKFLSNFTLVCLALSASTIKMLVEWNWSERSTIIFYWFAKLSYKMVEFSDLFDNEDDVFQKKAKVCSTQKWRTHPPPAFSSCFTLFCPAKTSGKECLPAVSLLMRLHWSAVFGLQCETSFAALTLKALKGRVGWCHFRLSDSTLCWPTLFQTCLVRRRDPKDVHKGRLVGAPVIHHASPQGLRGAEAIRKCSFWPTTFFGFEPEFHS